MQNYRPQCFVRTADITVALTWPEGVEDAAEKMIMPGDNVEMVCDLVFDVALEVGTRFTLREANKTSKSPRSSNQTKLLIMSSSWYRYRHQDLLVNVHPTSG